MSLRVGVLGAGAVGSYVGGLLAMEGVPTTLVARGDHAAAMAADGLHLDRRGEEPMDVAVAVATEAAALADTDVVIVTVKSPDTEAAADQIAPYIRSGVIVLSIQNGVGNWTRLAERLPDVTVLGWSGAVRVRNADTRAHPACTPRSPRDRGRGSSRAAGP